MDHKQILKQMIDFNKTAFDNSFNALLLVQEQNAKMMSSFMSQAVWIPEEGKKVVSDWVTAYRKGIEDFKATADENFKKVENYFAEA